jgi:hypothetical protein
LRRGNSATDYQGSSQTQKKKSADLCFTCAHP